jgi:hypothetical protein
VCIIQVPRHCADAIWIALPFQHHHTGAGLCWESGGLISGNASIISARARTARIPAAKRTGVGAARTASAGIYRRSRVIRGRGHRHKHQEGSRFIPAGIPTARAGPVTRLAMNPLDAGLYIRQQIVN